MDDRRLSVSEIPISPIKKIFEVGLRLGSSVEDGCRLLMDILRWLKPTIEELRARHGSSRTWPKCYSRSNN
jgi:hypothetical protein